MDFAQIGKKKSVHILIVNEIFLLNEVEYLNKNRKLLFMLTALLSLWEKGENSIPYSQHKATKAELSVSKLVCNCSILKLNQL